MRVVVNQLAAAGRKTGIGHYTRQLLRCLRKQACADHVDAFPSGFMGRLPDWFGKARMALEPGDADIASESPTPMASVQRIVLNELRQANRAFWSLSFRRTCADGGYDLYHESNFIPFHSDCRTIATVHDLSVLLHPEWHPVDRVKHFERHFRRSLHNCCHFLAISEFGRQEIIRTLNISPDQVTRTYMGVRPGLSPLPPAQVADTLRQLRLPPRYLLYLGTIEPRKNVLMLLRAYCSLPDSIRGSWPLLLVGGWGWNSRDVAEFLHNEARHRGVIHLGYLPEEHIAAIYNGARALLYPSLYEGFGMPPIEMLACGGAVLASTAGALVETLGNRACLLAPDDIDGWRRAMLRVIQDDAWRHSLQRGGPTLAARFTWDECAAATWRVYRSIAGRSANVLRMTAHETQKLAG